MQGTFPLRSEGFEWKKLDETYLLTNKDGASIELDPISFLVWVQCDGRTSVTQIIDVFAIGGNHDIIESAIRGVLEKLTESGAIAWV